MQNVNYMWQFLSLIHLIQCAPTDKLLVYFLCTDIFPSIFMCNMLCKQKTIGKKIVRRKVSAQRTHSAIPKMPQNSMFFPFISTKLVTWDDANFPLRLKSFNFAWCIFSFNFSVDLCFF